MMMIRIVSMMIVRFMFWCVLYYMHTYFHTVIVIRGMSYRGCLIEDVIQGMSYRVFVIQGFCDLVLCIVGCLSWDWVTTVYRHIV
jgi:hypothetical protein